MKHPPTKEQLIGHLKDFPNYRNEVLEEFSDLSSDDLAAKIRSVEETSWIFEASNKLSPEVYSYYFPVFVEYAHSRDSEYDCHMPGWFAMSVDVQVRNSPRELLDLFPEFQKILSHIQRHLPKYYADDSNWAKQTNTLCNSVLKNISDATPA
ncbi:hypothetical protein ACFSW8_03800 [Rubritalea tangerina]|uniref:Uncharacterized protein n=2 Tax=Rubritalea tangerina TaxID=430798 RepID=A0ABW4Z7W8_9BACT